MFYVESGRRKGPKRASASQARWEFLNTKIVVPKGGSQLYKAIEAVYMDKKESRILRSETTLGPDLRPRT